MAERWEWVEIIEPHSKDIMYANLTSGECVWDPPPGVNIKKSGADQWWELFDSNTSRFYYYNATSQKTVWHRPTNCDIIPLAKLQTLKQNTESRAEDGHNAAGPKREMGTQTPVLSPRRKHGQVPSAQQSQTSPRVSRKHRYGRQDSTSSLSSSGRTDTSSTRGDYQRHSALSSHSTPGDGLPSFIHQPQGAARRDSFEMPQRTIIDSPQPQRSRLLHKTASDSNMMGSGAVPGGVGDQQGGELRYLPPSMTQSQYKSGASSPSRQQQVYAANSSPRKSSLQEMTSRSNKFPYEGFSNSPIYVPPSSYHQDVPSSVREPVFNRDLRNSWEECLPFSQDIVGQQRTSSPVPSVKSKPKAFPRTNPTCVRREGQTGFQRDAGHVSFDVPYPESSASPSMHQSRSYTNDAGESVNAPRHERSESDSSSRTSRSDRAPSDSYILQCRDVSDAILGSMQNKSPRHVSDTMLGRQDTDDEAFRSGLAFKSGSSSYIGGVGLVRTSDHDLPRHERSSSQPYQSSTDRGKIREPDYANLPRPGWAYAAAPPPGPCPDSNTPASLLQEEMQLQSKYPDYDMVPDQSFEDSDSSMLSSSSQRGVKQSSPIPLNSEAHHASLRRKKGEASTAVERSQSLQADMMHRPTSMVVPSKSEATMSVSPTDSALNRQKLPSESDIESYAHQHLNRHKKGLFGKKVPLNNMLTWSKDPIQKPMIRTNDKSIKKEACDLFKLVQLYMGDRRSKQTPASVALDIITKGWSAPSLRDEIFMQLIRQTTDNKKEESLTRGWELMAMCLHFFPPSASFYTCLESYVTKHKDPALDLPDVPVSQFAGYCSQRLERSMQVGAKKGLRKPTLEEVEQAMKSVFHPSMFGSSLDEVMLMQRETYPERRLPWIQTVLSEEVLKMSGTMTEGIFRVPGDIDEVNALKVRCDQWMLPSDCQDPHVPASLLKQWYRELSEPLIPPNMYNDCVDNHSDPVMAVTLVHRLPEINRLVMSYLIRFLQVFAAADIATVTKMDVNNLAMVMAPNCLRCESQEPEVIFENTRKEMGFLRTLILSLDTSFMEGVV